MPFQIIRDDITRLNTDAIVNAANPQLLRGGGVCGSIFRAAGADELSDACRPLAPVAVGQAVITPGFRLPARYIIHTPGPVWRGGGNHEQELLISCYLSTLRLARAHGLTSVAFPLISGGIYGYPKAEAITSAASAIRSFLTNEDDGEMDVYLVLYSQDAYLAGTQLFEQVTAFINEHEVQPDVSASCRNEPDWWMDQTTNHRPTRNEAFGSDFEASPRIQSAPCAPCPSPEHSGRKPVFKRPGMDLDEAESQLRQYLETLPRPQSFAVSLLKLIDRKGMQDSQVYKAANMDKRLFSKIRSLPDYHPRKENVFALCLALQLETDEAIDLLAKAGYAFSDASRVDLAVRWFLDHHVWDVDQLNLVLTELHLPQLGVR